MLGPRFDLLVRSVPFISAFRRIHLATHDAKLELVRVILVNLGMDQATVASESVRDVTGVGSAHHELTSQFLLRLLAVNPP